MKNVSAQLDELETLRRENAALRAQIAWLKQKVFGGAKSEKLDQAQLRFHLEELEKLAAQGQERIETITYERTKAAKETKKCVFLRLRSNDEVGPPRLQSQTD